MIRADSLLGFRQLQNGDEYFLTKWLSNEAVLKCYEGRDRPFTLAKVKHTYFQQNKGVTRCLIQYGETPIGYMQYYEIEEEDRKFYGYLDGLERIYGMDQFIGEPAYWNQGLGSRLVNLVKDYLLSENDANRVVVDPQTWNERAIRCYEKCGFKKVKLLPKRELHEGEYRDCWLMEYIRESR